jgi:hypothetical protein
VPSRLPNGNIKAEFSPLNRFTRANAGVYLVVDLAPFIARITDPSSGDSDTAKLDQAVAAMLAEKVFLVRPLVFFSSFQIPVPSHSTARRNLRR